MRRSAAGPAVPCAPCRMRLTILPRPLRCRLGTTAFVVCHRPRTLMRIIRSHSSSEIFDMGFNSRAANMAALLIRISIGPNASSVSATIFSSESLSVISALSPSASPPASLISATIALLSAMSALTIRAPSAANARANSAPIPCAAPVITATLLSNRPMKISSYVPAVDAPAHAVSRHLICLYCRSIRNVIVAG